MNKWNVLYLILRYPTLKQFILDSYTQHKEESLIDFLHALETDTVSKENYV